MDVGGHGAQTFATDHTELAGRQASPQVFILVGVDQIPESFDVDRADRSTQARTSPDLQASRYGYAQNGGERKYSGDDENKGQIHWCSNRSNSWFQTARLCSGSGTAEVEALLWGRTR